MERLTTDRDCLVDKAEYERHLAQGYPRNMARERFIKLCEYERTGHTPEEIADFDRMYLEKCQEVNRLTAELAELKKQPQGDLISKSLLIKSLSKVCGDMDLVLPDQIWDIITAQTTAYDMEKVVEKITNINTTWNCQKCEYLKICDDIEKCGDEHLDLCAEVVKALSVDIVRKGGKE